MILSFYRIDYLRAIFLFKELYLFFLIANSIINSVLKQWCSII